MAGFSEKELLNAELLEKVYLKCWAWIQDEVHFDEL